MTSEDSIPVVVQFPVNKNICNSDNRIWYAMTFFTDRVNDEDHLWCDLVAKPHCETRKGTLFIQRLDTGVNSSLNGKVKLEIFSGM